MPRIWKNTEVRGRLARRDVHPDRQTLSGKWRAWERRAFTPKREALRTPGTDETDIEERVGQGKAERRTKR